MLFFAITFTGNIFRYRLLRKEKWAVLLLHLSWVLIIIGAFVTHYISFEERMPIREGNSENVLYSDKTGRNAFVNGKINGQLQLRKFKDKLIVTLDTMKSSLS